MSSPAPSLDFDVSKLKTSVISLEEAAERLTHYGKWQWLYEQLKALPDDKSLSVEIPEGANAAQILLSLKSFLAGKKKSLLDAKWNVRKTADKKAFIISRTESSAHTITTGEKPAMTLAEAVRRAAAEPVARTSTELTDRVQQMLPDALRTSIQSTICTEIANRRLHKNADMKIRPVLNGKIV